jgi:glycosyltransferase involved in cell wall biosynthesis
MKIAHIIFDLNTGGAETMLVDIINEQVKTEQVALIIINDEINNRLLHQIDKQVNVIFIGRKEKSRNPIPLFILNWHLLQINADLIHCHHLSVIKIIFYKKNVVITIHTTGVPVEYLGKYKKVFAISNTVKKDIEVRCKVKPILVYNGIRLDEILKKEDYTYKTFKIVQVSRLDHEIKGQHILLEALKILVYEKEIKNICVDFIGEGKSFEYLKKLVEEYKIKEYVNFLGIRDRKYIYEYLKEYNLLVQPSLYEGFGLTIVEAMAAKVPVLVSDIEGPSEVIGNGKYGMKFNIADVRDCGSKIFEIMNKKGNIVLNECNEVLKFVKQNFSVSETAAKYINSYKSLINE